MVDEERFVREVLPQNLIPVRGGWGQRAEAEAAVTGPEK